MRRILASLILITTFVIVAATARADSSTPAASLASSTTPRNCPDDRQSSSFSLLDPSTWRMPHYDWSSFKIQDPNSWPFIPVPEVATDPNGGVTYGVLPVWLFTDDKNEISSILAPDINSNSTLGPGGNFRYLAYPVVGHQLVCGRRRAGDHRAQGRSRLPDRPRAQELVVVRGPILFREGSDRAILRIGKQLSLRQSDQLHDRAGLRRGDFGAMNLSDKLQLSMTERPR